MSNKKEIYVSADNKLSTSFTLREGAEVEVKIGISASKGGVTVEAFSEPSLYEVMKSNVAWKGIFESVVPHVQEAMVQNTTEIFEADAFKAVSRLTLAGLAPEDIAQKTGLTGEAITRHLRYHKFRTGESDDDPSYDNK